MRRGQSTRRVLAQLDELSEESAGRVLRNAFKVLAGASVGLAQARAGRMRWRAQSDVLGALVRSKAAHEATASAPALRELPDGSLTLFGLSIVETDESPGRWGLTLEIGS